jgi:hypothetical protein
MSSEHQAVGFPTTLIEAPIASKLGHHRAYFFTKSEVRLRNSGPTDYPAQNGWNGSAAHQIEQISTTRANIAAFETGRSALTVVRQVGATIANGYLPPAFVEIEVDLQ